MPSWIYWILAVICVIGATGLIRAWRRFPTDFRPAILLLILSVVLVALGIWRYSLVALGTDQGRLLYPAISAIVTLLALGLAAWTAARWRPVVATTGIVALAGLSVYGLVGVIQPAFARPLAVTETGLNSESDRVRFGELVLVDWQTSPEPQLLWYAPQKPTDDWRTNLRVVAEDGSLVWEWRRSPGYGRWSTDHWPAGTTLRDEYEVDWPDWAGPGRYRLELSVQPLFGDPVIPVVAGQPATTQDQGIYFLGWLDRK
jgi:hypothetical protein